MPNLEQKWANDKRQLTDAVMLPQRIKPLGPTPNQQTPTVRGQVGPMSYQMPAGAPNPGAQFGAPAIGGQQPMATQFAGVAGGVQGQVGPANVGINAQMGPQGNFQGANIGASMPMGGGNFDVNAALNNAMALQMMQGRYSQGPFSASASYAPGQGVGGEIGYQQGPLSVSGGYNPQRGATANIGLRQPFQEGGLATSIRNAPQYREQDVDFINTRNQHMREVSGKSAYAEGGGVWTRKEGQNPEGGLNAKGRASLRAQGHDIKPPVSAKQAKKSPKAAARRSSFCARMSGMPGPMKDEKGRPTRKALSLRKWDC